MTDAPAQSCFSPVVPQPCQLQPIPTPRFFARSRVSAVLALFDVHSARSATFSINFLIPTEWSSNWPVPVRDPGTKALFSLNRSEEHTSELQSPCNLVCRLLLE